MIGKIGTDIQDNKCSWLVVQALDIVSPNERQILEDNYGQHNPKMVRHELISAISWEGRHIREGRGR